MKPQITAGDITFACGVIAANREACAPRRPLPTTPARRRAAIIRAGRDALAGVLLKRHGLKWHQLTAAIRAGAVGEPLWFEINKSGAQALGIWEE